MGIIRPIDPIIPITKLKKAQKSPWSQLSNSQISIGSARSRFTLTSPGETHPNSSAAAARLRRRCSPPSPLLASAADWCPLAADCCRALWNSLLSATPGVPALSSARRREAAPALLKEKDALLLWACSWAEDASMEPCSFTSAN
ncbi:uncharacterized protein LOC131025317 isoform X2 [Salvia miltiorrhiza]|uniref:uncharacterized protein LOC131025317 isoform X2 n=1 Tax=Salvia miltiorrhiza TaxID=226208 RepID=UPI0025AB5F20|nr:uncharacterized protein LOC131025317 isoform X2 [Salvia miltiorrhiza]